MPRGCSIDPICGSLTSLPSLAYLATACVLVLLACAVLAYCTFRRAERNRWLFVLPLVLVVPAFLVTIQDWNEVAAVNAANAAHGGYAFTFPPPWIVWSAGYLPGPTPHTCLLLPGTLVVTLFVLLKVWVEHFADH